MTSTEKEKAETKTGTTSPVPSDHSRIHVKPLNYHQLIDITREDVTTIWNDEPLCKKYQSWMSRALKNVKEPKKHLRYMEYYVEECLKELDLIPNPCDNKENEGKYGAQLYPKLSVQSDFLLHEIIPLLTETLLYTKPAQTSVFAFNHFFRLILHLCKRCIELDIECFRLLEMIFGFLRNDPSKQRFYDHCGLPIKGVWTPEKYGNRLLARFLKIKDLQTESQKIYEISSADDYPNDYTICTGLNDIASKQSWFRIQNINYFCHIGGFATLFKRISHNKWPVSVSGLVNLMRPIAQLRDLYNDDIMETYVTALSDSLLDYYKYLPTEMIQDLKEETVEKTFKNLHYLMHNAFEIGDINASKIVLRFQVASTQFRSPFMESRISAMNQINKHIILAIERDEFKETHKEWKDSFDRNSRILWNLGVSSKFIQECIEEECALEFILNQKTTDIELLQRLGPMYRLLRHTKSLEFEKYVKPLLSLPVNETLVRGLVPTDFYKRLKYLAELLVGGYVKSVENDRFVSDDLISLITLFYFS